MYVALSLLTVFINISVPTPTMKQPDKYGLAECSGVFIGPSTVLSAAHCYENRKGEIWIRTYEGKSFSVKVQKIDYTTDLALLSVEKLENHAYADIGKAALISEPVYTVNASHGYVGTYTQGIVNNIVVEYFTQVLTILHSANIASGASGSGLFNKKKQLIGINTATVRGFNEAVHIDVINKFLENEPIR